MNEKSALVTGVSGQDGYIMAEKLLKDGFRVIGLSRSVNEELRGLSSAHGERLEIVEFNYAIKGMIKDVICTHMPDVIFNFAAKATGQGMFDNPQEMNRLNAEFVLDILEAIRTTDDPESISFCQASSSEMFGRVEVSPQDEETCFRPISPYGAAKLYAHNLVSIYRSAFGLRCSSAILYNHESVRRSPAFVTRKIASFAARIKLGLADELTLGDLTAQRDWGYAPEYMEALYRMAFNDTPDDYIVSSGKLTMVADLCESAFGHLDLDYRDYVRSDVSDSRKNNSRNLLGNPAKIKNKLGWCALKSPAEIMIELVDNEIEELKKGLPSIC
jgi:GDPmannose 4,6-dehydratase